jgi:hypothetical protein
VHEFAHSIMLLGFTQVPGLLVRGLLITSLDIVMIFMAELLGI